MHRKIKQRDKETGKKENRCWFYFTSRRDIEFMLEYKVFSDTFVSDSVFSFIKFTWEVKVTAIFYSKIKHGSFPSLYIGENYGTILEFRKLGVKLLMTWRLFH